MKSLLLEIAAEEIPAGYIAPALKALLFNLLKKMDDVRLMYGEAQTFGTPRRLAVYVTQVADKQESMAAEMIGPPARVGFDKNGKPTVAAEKFAEKAGVPLKKLIIKKTKKGEYLCARVTMPSYAAKTLLKEILPEVILSLPFPKTMRWGDQSVNFARPIHGVTAILGNKIIAFSLGNIRSGRYTTGHRFMHPGKIKIASPEEYIERLNAACVIADPFLRREKIESEICNAAQKCGGSILQDDDLLDVVTNLVEFPAVSAGKFDKKFLELPGEILITSMREHQKYFAVVDDANSIMPYFIVVNNTRAKDMDLVSRGHERVLRARLEDAMFFYNNDLKVSMDLMAAKLKNVLFQANLGSVSEKAERIAQIVAFLADELKTEDGVKDKLVRAARLCKADLVSQVVVEFPKLQGVMGRVYSLLSGESDDVAAAIEEHYLPVYSGGRLPATSAGAVLAIADKVDTICGCFAAGLIPTGASDPYALRRQSIGIVQIMLDNDFGFSLKGLIEKSAGLYSEMGFQDKKEISGKVYDFVQNRLIYLLEEEEFPKNIISSIVTVSIDNVPNVWERVKALDKLKKEPYFESLAVAFKRVVNIIKKSGSGEIKDVDEKLFQHESETALFSAYGEVKTKVVHDLEKRRFESAFYNMAALRNTVDAFFDGVLVMEKDPALRNNRLGLLKLIADLFGMTADFSKI